MNLKHKVLECGIVWFWWDCPDLQEDNKYSRPYRS